jgi:hypothetical protein
VRFLAFSKLLLLDILQITSVSCFRVRDPSQFLEDPFLCCALPSLVLSDSLTRSPALTIRLTRSGR